MQMETKFLQLRTEVTLGSWFGDWQVCWLGGWAKHRLYYLVMLVKIPKKAVLMSAARPQLSSNPYSGIGSASSTGRCRSRVTSANVCPVEASVACWPEKACQRRMATST